MQHIRHPSTIEPMLAKITDAIPAGDFLYEPNCDGFRAIVFRGCRSGG